MEPLDPVALQSVEQFDPESDGEAAKSRDLILLLLRHTPQPFARGQFAPGHITCTGLVLSPDRESLLLVHHRRLQRWLLPGGHVEPDDPSLAAAAQREVLEETGVVVSPSSFLASLDVHGIPPGKGEPYHLHHDLIWLFTAATLALSHSAEVKETAWAPLALLESYALPRSILRAAGCAKGMIG